MSAVKVNVNATVPTDSNDPSRPMVDDNSLGAKLRKLSHARNELEPYLGWFWKYPQWVQGLIVVSLYLGGGTIALSLIFDDWAGLDALYFSVVTLTTVGYGDKIPTNDGSRVFVILYGWLGLAMITTALGNFMDDIFERQQSLVAAAVKPPPGEQPGTRAQEISTRGVWAQLFTDRNVLVSLANVGLWLAVGTIFYTFDHEGSDRFIDALYIAATTSTTVGYGDLHPEGRAQKWFSIFWMVLMVFATAKAVSDVTDKRLQIKAQIFEANLLYTNFDRASVQDADTDNDGRVSRFEYLRAMLIKMGKISASEVENIMARFEEMDRAAGSLPDGYITQEDLDHQMDFN